MNDIDRSNAVITISSEHLKIVENVESAKTNLTKDILKDLANLGLAIIAAGITFMTVGSDFILTAGLFYTGMSILVIGVLLAFGIRLTLKHRFITFISNQYKGYEARTAAARGLILSNDKDGANYNLKRSIDDYPLKEAPSSKLINISDIIVALIIFVGAGISIVSVTVRISIG